MKKFEFARVEKSEKEAIKRLMLSRTPDMDYEDVNKMFMLAGLKTRMEYLTFPEMVKIVKNDNPHYSWLDATAFVLELATPREAPGFEYYNRAEVTA